jgi:hypothetical protein
MKPDIDHVRADGALVDGKFNRGGIVREGQCGLDVARRHAHGMLLVSCCSLSLLIIDICSAFRDFTVFAQCSMRDAFSRAAWALLVPAAA